MKKLVVVLIVPIILSCGFGVAIAGLNPISIDITPSCATAGSPVTITINTTDSEAYYKYWIIENSYCSEGAGDWIAVDDWTTNTSTIWIPTSNGRKAICVWIADDISTNCPAMIGASYEVGTSNCIDPVNVSISPTNGNVNEAVTITATVAAASLYYRFWVNKHSYCTASNNPDWEIIQDWSPNNTCTWTPDNVGLYTLIVWTADNTSRSCTGMGGMTYQVSEEVFISENCTVLDDTTLENLSSISSDGTTYVFSETSFDLESLEEGDVIVGDVAKLAPNGFLRNVVSVSTAGNEVYVETTQATLEDVIEQGAVQFSKNLTPKDITVPVASKKGVSFRENPYPRTSQFYHFTAEMDGVVLYDDDGSLTTTYDQIVANGSIEFSPGFDFNLQIKEGEIQQLAVRNTTTTKVQLEIQTEINILGIQNDVEIARYPFQPMPIMVDFVPVVLTPLITINVGFDGNASVGVTTSVTQEATLTTGLDYKSGAWASTADFANEFQCVTPSLSASCNFKGYAGPQLSLLLYGTVGPYSIIDAYLALHADLSRAPRWELYGGLEAVAGIIADVLGYSIADYYAPELIEDEELLAQGGVSENASPIATVIYPTSGSVFDLQETINFQGSGSDADGRIVSYAWDFADGSTSTSQNPSHAYSSIGTYTVTLTVMDDDGAMGSDSISVIVRSAPQTNNPPTATITRPSNGSTFDVRQTINFRGSGSDSDGSIVSYRWAFGDGSTSTSQNTSHSYSSAGTYTVTLTVTDDDGAMGSDSISLTVRSAPQTNNPPTATITRPSNGSTFDVGQTISFRGSGSDSDGSIVSYRWAFGDGSTSTSQNTSHSYSSAGTYTVTLTVTDDDGAINIDSITVTVVTSGGCLCSSSGGCRFQDNGNGTVTDCNTGLVWLRNANCFGKKSWQEAMDTAANLADGQCGLTDGSIRGKWRLPTKEEWAAFIDRSHSNPTLSDAAGTGQWSEGDAFAHVESQLYWSGTTYTANTFYAWGMSMYSGFMNHYNKSLYYYVWPVRRGN